MLVEKRLLGEQPFQVLAHNLTPAGALIGLQRIAAIVTKSIEIIGHSYPPVQVAK
jgi:hypothetical protein